MSHVEARPHFRAAKIFFRLACAFSQAGLVGRSKNETCAKRASDVSESTRKICARSSR